MSIALRGEFPELASAAIVAPRVGRRAWKQPVGLDRDGAVAHLYGIGMCPVTIFARRGGRVAETVVGNLTEDQLRRKTQKAAAWMSWTSARAGSSPTWPRSSRSSGCSTRGIETRPGRTPRPVKERLRTLSNRYTGAKVVHMRQEAVPWAYRVFFRQVGIDPDTHRTPVEQAALDRMKWGGFRSTNLVDDALLIATIETGVPVIAFDGDRVGSAIGLRLSEPDEQLGDAEGRPLSDRQIVVADEERSLAVLFDEIAPKYGVDWDAEQLVVAALEVKGVPRISVEEALWVAAEVLQTKE